MFALPAYLSEWTFPVWFIWWWNNYAWSLILKTPTEISPWIDIVFTWWTTITCTKQVHWYYFNAARWVWLLPLSSETLMSDGVSLTGWLYTSCNNGQYYDIIWMISYQKNGSDIGKVVFWVDTNLTNNSSNWTYQTGAISWKFANGLNWMFFDTMFGIGSVTSNWNQIWGTGSVGNLIWTFTNIYVQWYIGIWQSVAESEREILTVNLAGTKTLLTSNNEVLSSDVINTVSKNTTKQCRSSNTYTYLQATDWEIGENKFVCINLEDNDFTITSSQFDSFKNKDIVFLKWNVKLDKSIYTRTNYSEYLSIYVADWNLIFDSNISTTNLTSIDNNWFKVIPGWTNSEKTKWIYLVGNFITNGLILWDRLWGVYSNIPFKTLVHGRLVSLNAMTAVSTRRNTHLEQLLQDPRTTTYSQLTDTAISNPYFPNGKWNASMWDVFAWKCADITTTWAQAQTGGMWAHPLGLFDWTTIAAVKSIPCPSWHRYPLSIIEKSLSTAFFIK